MFELMLMRHAKSDWHSHTADIDRPLNSRGRQDAVNMGIYLKEVCLVPDKMVVSVAQRTQETSSLLLNKLTVAAKDTIIDRDLYLADRETLCDVITAYASDDQRLLILAHNPGMDDLVSYLAREMPALSANGSLMTTCAVAYFHLETCDILKEQNQGDLKIIIRPKEVFNIT